ncbi:MAG: ubiquinol-cytochrome c reductase iron-sulfur subunit [Planctomycetota bacterium]
MWRSLGPLGDLPEDAPKRIAVSFTITDGWYQAPVERIYYARRTAASEPVVLSGRCTHLGCSVRWDRRTNDGFRCPCHGGVFDADGRVVKGPPRMRSSDRPPGSSTARSGCESSSSSGRRQEPAVRKPDAVPPDPATARVAASRFLAEPSRRRRAHRLDDGEASAARRRFPARSARRCSWRS